MTVGVLEVHGERDQFGRLMPSSANHSPGDGDLTAHCQGSRHEA